MTENTTPENTDSLTIDATLTDDTGVQVPVALEIRWPDGYGLHALQYLHNLPAYLDSIGQALMQQLVRSGDASMVAAAARMGLDDEAAGS